MSGKIAMVCLTFKRPRLLGRLIECFRRQTYENRELVILDDCGDYPTQPSGDRWRIVSVNERYPSLGMKRNAAFRLVSEDVEMVQNVDDDDLYMPLMLEAAVNALQKGPWAQGREAYEWDGQTITRIETFHRSVPTKFAFNGHWCFRLKEFWAVGGYPEDMDDDRIADRMTAAYGPSVDLLDEKFGEPFYVYSREPTTHHISWLYPKMSMATAWMAMDDVKREGSELQIGWDREYDKIPRPSIAQPRNW